MFDLDLLDMNPLKTFKGRLLNSVLAKHRLGKLSNSANLIAVFGSLFELTTSKLLQKENPEKIKPDARTRRGALKFRKSKNMFLLSFHFPLFLLL